MSSYPRLFDHFSAVPAGPDLRSVAERRVADSRAPPALGAVEHGVRDVDRRLALLDATLRVLLVRLRVALDEVHALDQNTVLARKDLEHLTGLARVVARHHERHVSLYQPRHHSTSGASETI